jgi:hypothetical protein
MNREMEHDVMRRPPGWWVDCGALGHHAESTQPSSVDVIYRCDECRVYEWRILVDVTRSTGYIHRSTFDLRFASFEEAMAAQGRYFYTAKQFNGDVLRTTNDLPFQEPSEPPSCGTVNTEARGTRGT